MFTSHRTNIFIMLNPKSRFEDDFSFQMPKGWFRPDYSRYSAEKACSTLKMIHYKLMDCDPWWPRWPRHDMTCPKDIQSFMGQENWRCLEFRGKHWAMLSGICRTMPRQPTTGGSFFNCPPMNRSRCRLYNYIYTQYFTILQKTEMDRIWYNYVSTLAISRFSFLGILQFQILSTPAWWYTVCTYMYHVFFCSSLTVSNKKSLNQTALF